jgi:YidC/Oxa1 family membrane protein insertase
MQTQLQRTILWIVFGMSLVLLWDKWQSFNGQPSLLGVITGQSAPKTPAAAPAAGNGAKTDASVPTASVPPAGASGISPAATAAPAPATGPTGQLIRLSNDVLALEIDTLGAQVKQAQLLLQKDSEKRDQSFVLLQDEPGRTFIAQSGLIGATGGSNFPTHRTQFAAPDGPRELSAGTAAVSQQFTAESGGIRLVRTYTLKRGAYVVDVKDELTNTSEAPVKPTLYMQLVRSGTFATTNGAPAHNFGIFSAMTQPASTYTGPVIYTDKGKFQKVDFADIDKHKNAFEASAADGWAAMIQHYFVSAWIPTDKVQREYYADKVDANLYRIGAKQTLPELAPNASTSVETRLLIGPQDQRMLEQVAPGLDLTVDYGWLTVIAKPIFWLLQWLHSVVGNWGWAIVLLTLIIKTAFFPLQAASYKSMARMKAVTPRMTQIRERYGSDRAKMNQAMMELYKQEKINPLGGCLPIVVQIPVFIALYWVLLASVEMRDAPWTGWIHDLSAPDPYYILPLIMAATMFIQTKLNPTPPDPVQAKIMMIMPLVFSVMFFFFPAGLVLYWLVNNCYSIAQQWVITRKMAGAPSKA